MRYKPRILIAEDDPMSQDMLLRRLTSRGFRVSAVSDGPSCLRSIESQPPDLLLLDIQMPGMNGLDVLKEIRKHFPQDTLPIILVTALGETEDVIKGLDSGANDYIIKPVNLPVLLARMNVSLKSKFGIGLLMEAERQRVLVETLKEACHQLAQPMTAVMVTLEGLIRHPPDTMEDVQRDLADVLRWAGEVGEVIHRMQKVGTHRHVSYIERLEMFDVEEPTR